MAVDLDAGEVTINYNGGSLTMVVGNAKHLFGEGNPLVSGEPVVKTVSVKQHTRTRVIGGPSKSIGVYSYTYNQWPSSGHGQAAGGTPITMKWEGSQGSWQARRFRRISPCAREGSRGLRGDLKNRKDGEGRGGVPKVVVLPGFYLTLATIPYYS